MLFYERKSFPLLNFRHGIIFMLESKFQAALISEIKARLPGCVVLKNDPNYIQGFPDLLVLYGRRWGALECKRSENERRQPNQEYYVQSLGAMSYAAFIWPANKDYILDELQQTLQSP